MNDRNFYIKIAHWYYTLGMTQDEIGKNLSMTRQKVNRIINNLPAMGIVSTQVNGFEDTYVEYEAKIESRFEVNRVIIAETYNNANYRPLLANRAASYIRSIIQPASIIGVSWGETLADAIGQLPYLNHPQCTVVQMVGAQNTDQHSLKSDEISRALADKLNCSCYNLYAPSILDNPKIKKMLLEERIIKVAYKMMKKCDIGIFGIGQLSEGSTMLKRGMLQKQDINQLREAGFVGDICVNPVRIDGQWEECPMRNRIISANMEILRAIPNVIAIAGGEEKVEAIIGCLASGVINTFIVDLETAKLICERI